jgi:hypothetical protein
VEEFRERFRKPIGQSFCQDSVVIIVFRGKLRGQFIRADSGRDGKAAEVIGPIWRDEVCKAMIELVSSLSVRIRSSSSCASSKSSRACLPTTGSSKIAG